MKRAGIPHQALSIKHSKDHALTDRDNAQLNYRPSSQADTSDAGFGAGSARLGAHASAGTFAA
ncbi:hypothetical protein BURKHO8Y_10349 [Burkholderia sp. 8Y]|nr:hypothetical protein BURKHO8Y_10349 [Burkholderia sp. 8Y]